METVENRAGAEGLTAMNAEVAAICTNDARSHMHAESTDMEGEAEVDFWDRADLDHSHFGSVDASFDSHDVLLIEEQATPTSQLKAADSPEVALRHDVQTRSEGLRADDLSPHPL